MTEEPSQESVEQLLEAAVDAAMRGDLDETTDLAQQVLAARPLDPEASALLALDESTADQVRRIPLLFVDVVGSSALSNQVEVEVYRSLMAHYRRVVLDVVEGVHGGTIDHFAGDGALARFGYPVPREGDARRSVQAGLDIVDQMAQLTPELQRDHGHALEVRVAAHCGLVYLDHARGDIFGPAPNLAARLQSLAAPGEVLVSAALQDLVGEAFVYETRTPQSVKGFDVPVSYARVVATRRESSLHPRAALTPFVGRASELSLLQARAVPTDPDRRPTVIVGEGGIGKSRLVAEFARSLRGAGVQTILAPSTDQPGASHLHPFRTALENHLGVAGIRVPATRLDALRRWRGADDAALPFLAIVLGVPPGAYDLPPLDSSKLYEKVLESVRAALEQIAAEAPTILVADDVHLADPASEQVFAELIANPIEGLSLIATARPGAIDGWPDPITLPPLATEESRSLLASLDPADGVSSVDDMVGRSDGIPLYLEALACCDQARETVGSDVPRSPRESEVPDAIYEPLVASLYRDPNQVDLAQVAATIGRDVDPDLLGAVLDVPPAELTPRLESLSEHRVLDVVPSTGAVRFHHALQRDLAYDLQPRDIRDARHRRIAAVLRQTALDEGIHGVWAEVAAHHDRGGQPSEALVAYNEAADELRQSGALHEAKKLLDRAVELAIKDPALEPREIDLRLRRSYLAVSTEGFASAAAVADLERAASLADRPGRIPQRVSVLTSTWAFRGARGELQAQRATAERFGELAADSPALSAQNIAGLGITDFFAGRHGDAYRLLITATSEWEEAPPVAEASAGWHVPNSPGVSMYAHLGVSAWFAGDPSSAAYFERAGELASDHEFPTDAFSRCYLLGYRGWILTEEGRLDDALAAYGEMAGLGDRHGFDFWTITAMIHMEVVAARTLLSRSDPNPRELTDAAERLAGVTAMWTGLNTRAFEPYPLTWHAALLAAAGSSGAVPAFTEAFRLMDTLGLDFYRAEALRLQGLFSGEPGLRRRALELSLQQEAHPFALRASLDIAREDNDDEPLHSVIEGLPRTAAYPEQAHATALLTR